MSVGRLKFLQNVTTFIYLQHVHRTNTCHYKLDSYELYFNIYSAIIK